MSLHLNIKDENTKILQVKIEGEKRIELQTAKFIGDFSVNGGDKLCPNSTQYMKYIKSDFRTNQKVKFNLNEQFKKEIPREMANFFHEREKIFYMQQWILENKLILIENPRQIPSKRIFPDFIFRRGTLKTILDTTLSPHCAWKITIIKYHDTFYLSSVITEDEKLERLRLTPLFWGPKFEDYMTDESKLLDENEDYYCVADTILGGHRLLIYGKINAVDRNKYTRELSSSMDAYIDLKTSRILTLRNASENFRKYKKQATWWQQCAVFGIKEIVCGFRDDKKIVNHIETIQVKDLPTYAGNANNFNTNQMLNFAATLFDWIKTVVTKEKIVYRIEYDPSGRKVTCRSTSEMSFLTDEFLFGMFPE